MIESRVVSSSSVNRSAGILGVGTSAWVQVDRALRLLGTLWVGIMAGFFFAFSAVVMPGLDVADPNAALDAMQSINDVVVNPAFALFFFGAPMLCLAAIARALVRCDRLSILELVAAVVYLAGVFGVTVAFNVPLNDELATLDPTVPANAPAMTAYIAEWTLWNHVRTVSGLIAFALFAASLLVRAEPQETHGAPANR